MQKPNNEFVETVLMAIPADMLEEVGIGPCSTVQMHVSRGRIIIQAVDEEACGGSRYCPCDLSLIHISFSGRIPYQSHIGSELQKLTRR